jgi:hypothetical protein
VNGESREKERDTDREFPRVWNKGALYLARSCSSRLSPTDFVCPVKFAMTRTCHLILKKDQLAPCALCAFPKQRTWTGPGFGAEKKKNHLRDS